MPLHWQIDVLRMLLISAKNLPVLADFLASLQWFRDENCWGHTVAMEHVRSYAQQNNPHPAVQFSSLFVSASSSAWDSAVECPMSRPLKACAREMLRDSKGSQEAQQDEPETNKAERIEVLIIDKVGESIASVDLIPCHFFLFIISLNFGCKKFPFKVPWFSFPPSRPPH